jgi:acylphosphatase
MTLFLKRLHLFISGRVQMVGFRAFTVRIAHELGLTGWVKNLDNGQAEVVVEGEEKNLEKFVDLCWQGSRLAKVTEVEMYSEPRENLKDFQIIY